MPRVIRDSDEEVEIKSSTRRTRASSAASSVSITDSPARRTTRSNKQLAIIESSPESLDDSNTQPRVRTTRSRTATLDKSATAGTVKNLRSRKNSASSNLSETIDLEPETTQKRVTRKTAATAAAAGTPTKTNLRSRNLRAGSEAKSTPPTTTRSTRLTRASSVDPINTPNESVGTPNKRRTRASMVPAQQTVTEEEEEEAKNKIPECLNNTVVEIDGDSENESVSTKGKTNKKVAKNRKETGKDSSTEQSNLDTSKTNEENMTDNSCTSNDSNGDSTLKALTMHSITSKLESFTPRKTENSEKIDQVTNSESLVPLADQNLIKSDEFHSSSNENNCGSVKIKVDINDDECEHVDVENITLTDDSIDIVNSPKKVDTRDTLALDIKDSYVKLNRTNLVEKIVSEKLEENKNYDNNLPQELNNSDNVSQNNVITNTKTAIVLVNDFVKSNEYCNIIKDQKNFDSGISLDNREDKNLITFVHNNDDQLSIVSIDDNDEVMSLNLSSPSEKEIQNDKFIVEGLPDDEKNYFAKVTDESVPMNVNNIADNFSSEMLDVCLKENVPESKLKSEILVGEKNNNFGNFGALNVVNNNIVEIACETGDELISKNTSKVDSFKIINASGDNIAISNSLHKNVQHNDSVSMGIDDNVIVSVNINSSIAETNLTATESKDDAKNEVAESSEIESICGNNNTNSNVGSDENIIIKKNDSVNINSIKTEQSNRATDTNEQLELTDPSKSESNSKENRVITNSCVFIETNSNEIEPKLSLEDKNGVPSAVTDADGDNASSPIKEEETHETSTDTTSTKSLENCKRKSRARVIDSDLDESAENLFQDIPAEEWSREQSKRNSFNEDRSAVKESDNGEEDGSISNKSRKSFDENEVDKSLVEITNVANETGNREADLSLSKKARKSLEKKRESGQSSDSGIQDGNKTIVENDADENGNGMAESRSKSRRSSAQNKNDTIAERLSLVDRKSLNKSRQSLDNSGQFNVSVFDNFRKKNDSLSTSLNTANASRKQSLSGTRKSIAEEKKDEHSEAEAMEIDEAGDSESEMNRFNDSSSKSRKSATKNDSIAEESSVSLNDSKIAKRLSLDKSLNKSSRKSSIERIQEAKIVDNEEIEIDFNKSTKEVINNMSLSKSQNFFNESLSKSDGLSENLNESKKSKQRLSEKFNKSTRKSSVKEQTEEDFEDEEMEVDVVSDKSPNRSRKSLDEPLNNKRLNKNEKTSANAEAEVSLNNEDKSLEEKSNRKSANRSLNSSDVVVDVDSELEAELHEDDENKNKSTSKFPKASSKSFFVAPSAKDAENLEDSMTESSPKKKKGQDSSQSVLDRSLQKSIERMKFSNPPKHNISTVVQVNSSSENDSDDSQIPNFMFKSNDEEDTKDSSDEEEKEENDIDSDIEREYNLEGKSIIKYSDDDVPGDDCRVSEEESSDNEDDGADLQDFVVPDEEVEEDEDDDDDDDDDDEDDVDDGGDEDDDGDGYEDVDVDEDESEGRDGDEDENENEDAKVECSKEKKINVSKKNVNVSSPQSSVKNTSTHLQKSGFSQSSGSESDDEATEAENKNSKERFEESEKLLENSKTIKGKNTSLQKKDKSIDKSSKSTKSNVSSSSESDDEDIPNEGQTKAKDRSLNVSVKNKSLNLSKSTKDKSASLSKRNSDKNAVTLNNSKPDKNNSIRMEDNDQTESSSSESDDSVGMSKVGIRNENRQIASPSEAESESEEGEDYYRIVNVESRDASLLKPKNKKLIDCSTPKPGAAKKTDFSRDNLSITASRRKSGSLNDLSDTKMMSSRLSIGEAASKSMKVSDTSMKLKDDVEIVATPETVSKTRQAWKLIPLNHTAHPTAEDTPGTKFLKKAKLNDSFPVLESMKSSDLSSATKKSKKAAEQKEPEVELNVVVPKERTKSKKRKLLDMSNVQSVDEDSILKVSKKNKKRARFDDSKMPAADQEEQIEQGIKKKSKQMHGKQATDLERVEEVPKSKKKKKSKAKEVEVDEVAEKEDAPEEKPTKKRKKKLLNVQEAVEEGENLEPEKPAKKRSRVIEAKQVESLGSKNKSKKKVADGSDDEAPESVGLEEARRLALNKRRQELEGIEAAKESLKKKRKGQVQKEKHAKSLKRLPEDVLDSLTDEPLRRPDKRQKLSRNKERSVVMPSKSMFSPGKIIPENLRVDDGYISLSSTGGTTQFAVINLRKAKKVAKKSAAVLNFREKMLARNARMPTTMYLSYLKKQKAKSNI